MKKVQFKRQLRSLMSPFEYLRENENQAFPFLYFSFINCTLAFLCCSLCYDKTVCLYVMQMIFFLLNTYFVFVCCAKEYLFQAV